jgi:hypothetical protein
MTINSKSIKYLRMKFKLKKKHSIKKVKNWKIELKEIKS